MDITKPLSNLNPVAIFAARWLNRYVKLFLSVIIWLHSGCSKPTESSIPIVNVPKNISGELLLSDIAKSVKTIQLETNENALLSDADNVKIFDGQLFVGDYHRVLIFDMQGNFLDSLGSRGQGPGEYRRNNSFTLDPATGTVYLATDSRILVYTADLKLSMEKKLPASTYYLDFADEHLYMALQSHGNIVEGGFATYTGLVKLSPQLEFSDSIPVKTVVLKEYWRGGYPFKHFLSKNERGVYLYYPVLDPENMLRDTVYRIEGNKLIPSIKLRFEKPQSLNERGFQSLAVLNIIHSSSYLICEYDQDGERRLFIYNTKTSTGCNLKTGPLDDHGDPIVLRPLDLEKDRFFYIKTAVYSDSKTEEPNPIIGIVELK